MYPRPDRLLDIDAAPELDGAEVGRIFREESGRSVAALIRVFGDIDVAEDAVQEAFAVALRKWPADGLPPNPGAWITTTARNRAIDRLRRESRGRALLSEAAVLAASPRRRDPCRTTGFASSSPAATRHSPRKRRSRSPFDCSAACRPTRSQGRF
jgi:DNA-directed RNA polymerase specialized sigma24 family protein